MRLLKSLGVGLCAAIAGFVSALAFMVVVGGVFIWTQRANGAGGIGAYAIGLERPVFIGLVAGIAAFVWQWRRSRRATSI